MSDMKETERLCSLLAEFFDKHKFIIDYDVEKKGLVVVDFSDETLHRSVCFSDMRECRDDMSLDNGEEEYPYFCLSRPSITKKESLPAAVVLPVSFLVL